MTSIRGYLISFLLALVTLSSFLSAIQVYRTGQQHLQELLDQHLIDDARLLESVDTEPPAQRALSLSDTLIYQILTREGRILHQSPQLPATPLMPLSQGFDEVTFLGQRWRSYALVTTDQRWILVAEPLHLRDQILDALMTEMIWPVVMSLPLLMLAIGWVVGRGLSPLTSLSNQLRQRQEDDLEPITRDQLPEELQPLLVALNEWQIRLKDVLERERHFAADAAHELRTPVSILKLQLHNLGQHPALSEAAMAPAWQATADLGHLIEQLLMLYRSTPDQFVMKHEPVDLLTCAREVIAQHFEAIDARHQHIELQGETAWVCGHRMALTGLIENLVTNAHKYTPSGGTLHVTVSATAQHATLVVEDSGPGIPEADRTRALDRFQRLTHQSSAISGCGLGLAIVRHITQRHQGQLTLGRSDTLGGLCVTVRLPTRHEKRS